MIQNEEKIYPREIASYEIPAEGEKIVGLHAVVKQESDLDAILKIVRERNIVIRHLDISAVKDRHSVISAFLDFSKSHEEIQNFQASIEKLPCIEKLVLSAPGRILHQSSLFPIMNGNQRMILQSVGRMQYIRDQLERILTASGVAVIFYNMGLENGRSLHDLLIGKNGSHDVSNEKKMDMLRAHMISAGMGIFDFTNLDLKIRSGTVNLYDDYECDGLHKTAPICHIARGVLAGYIGTDCNDRRIKLVELKCRAIGDEFCQFAVGE